MSGIIKKYATENFFDRTWDNFEHRLERGQFSHAAFPGWLLIRSACLDCDEDVTVIKYKGRRIQLVPSGDNQMGKTWVIHQCDPRNLPDSHKPANPDDRPDYGTVDDILEAQHEARGELFPDDPNVRDGDGNIRSGGWDD